MASKLNAQRLLEQRKVVYSLHPYTYDPINPPDAAAVAAQLGLDASLVYKTLIVKGMGPRPLIVMLAADRHLDVKRAAAALGHKRIELLERAETERLTGLKIGGIGALALTAKRWPCYLDAAALTIETIYVNAGQRGLLLGLHPHDLVAALAAQVITAT